tara:strand:- start:5170 stop:5514 length:345 start_codon:yes stop_codon:yes gene_type:complete
MAKLTPIYIFLFILLIWWGKNSPSVKKYMEESKIIKLIMNKIGPDCLIIEDKIFYVKEIKNNKYKGVLYSRRSSGNTWIPQEVIIEKGNFKSLNCPEITSKKGRIYLKTNPSKK